MEKILKEILNWSEVWALLIPLAFMLWNRNQASYLKPIRIYVVVALVLYIAINIIWRFKISLGFEDGDFWYSNNFIYNIQSIVRFLCFTWFFILLKQPFLATAKKIIPVLFVIFLLVNFIFLEDFFYYWSFSSRLLSLETGILLVYCLQYYFYILKEDSNEDKRPPAFWVVTGLSVFVVINFPIFLFYKAFLKQFKHFAVNIWDVTNIAFIIFCVLLAKAFYGSRN